MRSRRGSATKSLTLWCTPKNNSKWRERSRKRSQSRTPFHLSEKDRMEQLEIAKANAAKSLGIANLDWSASLRTVPVAKETNYGTPVPNAAKFERSWDVLEEGHRPLSSPLVPQPGGVWTRSPPPAAARHRTGGSGRKDPVRHSPRPRLPGGWRQRPCRQSARQTVPGPSSSQ
ncbi:arginine/serine-rich protein 1-like isoform X3 [Lemur catta]|uniref:arginine/serine-rich protein 1-like isoform X3 n=1 Tax=Lemur catta TaxID=9447 RepID=UPI001E26A19D|nr:arginine/serine-rich protein 1-like isoform X3 [Lemur catta]